MEESLDLDELALLEANLMVLEAQEREKQLQDKIIAENKEISTDVIEDDSPEILKYLLSKFDYFTEEQIKFLKTRNSYVNLESYVHALDLIYGDYWSPEVDLANTSITFTILFKEVLITNSNKLSHEIKDLYVKIGLTGPDLSFAGYIRGTRGILSNKEFYFGGGTSESRDIYQHSHLSTDLSSLGNFYGFCLGSSELATLTSDYVRIKEITQAQAMKMCLLIDSLISWESLEGTPYRYIATILNSNSNDPNHIDVDRTLNFIYDEFISLYREHLLPIVSSTDMVRLTNNDNRHITEITHKIYNETTLNSLIDKGLLIINGPDTKNYFEVTFNWDNIQVKLVEYLLNTLDNEDRDLVLFLNYLMLLGTRFTNPLYQSYPIRTTFRLTRKLLILKTNEKHLLEFKKSLLETPTEDVEKTDTRTIIKSAAESNITFKGQKIPVYLEGEALESDNNPNEHKITVIDAICEFGVNIHLNIRIKVEKEVSAILHNLHIRNIYEFNRR